MCKQLCDITAWWHSAAYAVGHSNTRWMRSSHPCSTKIHGNSVQWLGSGEARLFCSMPSTIKIRIILWWFLANPSCMPNWKSLASAVVEILKGNPQFFGSSLNPGPHPLFLVGFYDGPWQTQLHTKFEVTIFNCCRNIKGDAQILTSFPSPVPRPLFFWWDLMMGLSKPHLLAKFEVMASSITEI